MLKMKFPFSHQLGARDCGPACLKMLAEYYGQSYAIDFLRDRCHITKVGVSLLGISECAEAIGFHSIGVKMELEQLKEIVHDQNAPAILHWNENHFVVVYKTPKPGRVGMFHIADPAKGLIILNEEEFSEQWIGLSSEEYFSFKNYSDKKSAKHIGYALLIETTPDFYNEPHFEGLKKKIDFSRLWYYFTKHKKYFIKLLLCMLVSNAILLVTPFLTQSLVDRGINLRDLNFLYLILLGQLLLFVASIISDVIRSYLLLYMGTRINISMVSDFFLKMLNLPVSFFEKNITGDLMQRINDHRRIENLLTVSSLNTAFSMLNLLVLGGILIFYSSSVFWIFIMGSLLGFGWTLLFLLKRRNIDFKLFDLYSKESNKVIEIFSGVQDIKISNSMRQKRWEWENIQSLLFKIKIKSFSITQWQNSGTSVFRQVTFIIITFITAKNVIAGHLSLGTMFAITMIVGMLSSPLDHLLELVTTLQDAKLGMERIEDVMIQKDEDPEDQITVREISDNENILIQSVTFYYGSGLLEPVLKNISLEIPAGKITAIVGASGSGKTTLMKLLLCFYDPQEGDILLGYVNFKNLHHGLWREKCGVVMQNGQLFSGTIAANISMGQHHDYAAIIQAASIAKIDEFIVSLPKQYETEIGMEGISISAGQMQRILLARAVYKNPGYLFLDEATSALDANTERAVIENLNQFFKGRTVVVIAHRLSTVKDADQLIVLDKGKIVEIGSHSHLSYKRGTYYSLIKNQLELGD